MKNSDIRQEVTAAGLRLWQVAYKLGLNDGNFSRKLRRELSIDEKSKIREAIKELREGEAND